MRSIHVWLSSCHYSLKLIQTMNSKQNKMKIRPYKQHLIAFIIVKHVSRIWRHIKINSIVLQKLQKKNTVRIIKYKWSLIENLWTYCFSLWHVPRCFFDVHHTITVLESNTAKNVEQIQFFSTESILLQPLGAAHILLAAVDQLNFLNLGIWVTKLNIHE